MNPFLATDGYKTSHKDMYPKGTTLVYSNFTPRHGKHSNTNLGGVISFGQQMVMQQIQEMFDDNFFLTGLRESDAPDKLKGEYKDKVCEEIKKEYSTYLGYEYDVSHIEDLWDLGYLPIKVKVLPEGAFVPYGVPVLTIVNTKPEFFWLTNFLETLISNMLWMPMTAATTAYSYKQLLTRYASETDKDNVGFVDFQGHNFGMRGMAGLDATVYSGIGHATSFSGDDSLPTIPTARKYYDMHKGFVVGSVPATEHSVMCAGGDQDELGTFRHLMEQFPTGVLSIVSDTWNLWTVCTEYLPILKDEIMARDGKIVIRPDSGDPVDIICGGHFTDSGEYVGKGTKDYIESVDNTPEGKGVIELLWDVFGGTINEQGYKVLDPHIGAIYGDSITLERAEEICKRLEAKGFASTNIVLGIGSFTYQYVTRDTHGFAMKATYVEISHPMRVFKNSMYTGASEPYTEGREIFKDPVTGDGSKKSAKGLLKVFQNVTHQGDHISYELQDQVSWDEEDKGSLQTIFEDGKFTNRVTLSEIRERLK